MSSDESIQEIKKLNNHGAFFGFLVWTILISGISYWQGAHNELMLIKNHLDANTIHGYDCKNIANQ